MIYLSSLFLRCILIASFHTHKKRWVQHGFTGFRTNQQKMGTMQNVTKVTLVRFSKYYPIIMRYSFKNLILNGPLFVKITHTNVWVKKTWTNHSSVSLLQFVQVFFWLRRYILQIPTNILDIACWIRSPFLKMKWAYKFGQNC